MLVKLNQSKMAAHMPETAQVSNLIQDVKNSNLATPLRFDQYGDPISTRSKSAAQTLNFGRPGKSQLGSRQPVGYLMNRNESRQRYFLEKQSLESYRARKILNRLPKNLIKLENQ